MRETILDAIGSPLVRVRSPEGATVAAKVEAFNPGGSAKDRPATAMVEAAERAGELGPGTVAEKSSAGSQDAERPGDAVVEATSGNTGIGLALVCAARGYDLTLVMPARMSEERRRLLRAYGATLELVEGDMTTARERAGELAGETGALRLRQFENEANPGAHYRTTAEEILDELDGRDVDAFVAPVGTGGTITGTATRLREAFPEMEVVGIEPEDNAVLSTGEAGDDEFQGMGPGFVSPLLDTDLLDDVETVALADAEAECRRLAREEGILVGQSSGAASIAARRVAERLAEPALDCPPAPAAVRPDGGPASSASGTSSELRSDGGTDYDDCPLVVTVLPDSGERYLSAGVFDAE